MRKMYTFLLREMEKHLNIYLTIQSQVLLHIKLSPTINRDSLRILESDKFEFRSN